MGWRRRLGSALEAGERAAMRASRATVERGIAAAERSRQTYAWYAVALRRIAWGAVGIAVVLVVCRIGLGLEDRTARSVETLAAAGGLTALLAAGAAGIAQHRRDAEEARAQRLRQVARDLG